jgi:hypothetical protein
MAALSVIFFILTTLLLTLMNATLGLGKALAIIERE